VIVEENIQLETIDLVTEIQGQSGAVTTSSIQRHLPVCDMLLLITETGHTIFCQENHPLFISRNKEILEIEAKTLEINDKIWIDNSITQNDNNIIPKSNQEHVVSAIINSEIKSEIVRNDNLSTLRLEPNFINYDKEWLEKFIRLFYKVTKSLNIKIESYNLIQQIKLICDRVGFISTIDLINIDDKVYFTIDINLEKTDTIIKNYVTILRTRKTSNWNSYVYDIKTNTNDFLLGCIQNHNSFHTGGAVILERLDLIKSIMETIDDKLEDQIRRSLEQVKEIMVCRSEFITLNIDTNIFERSGIKIKQEDNKYILPTGYFDIIIDDVDISVRLENETTVYVTEDTEVADNIISITYNKDDEMFHVKPKQEDYTKLARDFDSFVGGKSPWGDVPSLFLKFWKNFSHTRNYDSVHLEIVLSNILRNKSNPQILARLKKPYDPILLSIKKLPGVISWPLGLAFEDFSKAINQGLITDRGPESPIESVLFGSSLVDKGK